MIQSSSFYKYLYNKKRVWNVLNAMLKIIKNDYQKITFKQYLAYLKSVFYECLCIIKLI